MKKKNAYLRNFKKAFSRIYNLQKKIYPKIRNLLVNRPSFFKGKFPVFERSQQSTTAAKVRIYCRESTSRVWDSSFLDITQV